MRAGAAAVGGLVVAAVLGYGATFDGPVSAAARAAHLVAASMAGPARSDCDTNYSGCVPVASDVDCEGGTGNGPAYVRGPVHVTGNDIYRLDADHDGLACE